MAHGNNRQALTWIVESGLNEAADRLATAASNAGYRVIHWTDGHRVPVLDSDERAVFLGSLNACEVMPGVIGAADALAASVWQPLLGDLGLNPPSTSLYTTVGEVQHLDMPWAGERVFVRPVSAMKPFSGRVLDSDSLSPAALDHGFYYDDVDVPILVAQAQQVVEEWRFVAVNRQLVASSGYAADGRTGRVVDVPEGATALARVAATRAPCATVVIDVCRLKGVSEGASPFRVVEYNLFSGSDLYCCDVEAVVSAFDEPGTDSPAFRVAEPEVEPSP